MRIRHSLKSLIPVILMLASAQTVQAQGGPPMPAAGMPMPGAQQVPGSYGMYPYQSPYQGMFEQTYQRDGTWFQNSVNGFGPNNRPRDWFVNLDYTRTHNRKMSGLVGADNVQTYLQQTFPATGSTAGGTAGGTGSAASFSNLKFYDAAAASIIPNLKTNGIKLSGGFWNPDGSGFLYSGGYQFENSATFDARERAMARRMNTADALPLNLGGRTDLDILKNDILAPGVVFDSVDAVDYGPFGTAFDVLDRSLFNLYGLPTTDGNTASVLNGETAPYDLQFLLRQTINTGGANAAWAFSPVYDNDNIKVRPIVGGRYFRIDETFLFEGASTLLAYSAGGGADSPANSKIWPPDTGIAAETTATTTGTYTAVFPNATSNIVYSYINSQVVSNLSGPELGFQYDLGRTKGIQVTGSTRVAAMFNNEKLRMSGDNIGNFMGTALAAADPVTAATVSTNMFNTDTTQGPSLNAFSDTSSSTHLSPLFEQSLNAQVPIFGRVPVLRDMWQLEDAKLSLGWTFLLIGQVAEPNDSIVYDSSPVTGDFLHYSVQRDMFYQNTFNVGVNWSY